MATTAPSPNDLTRQQLDELDDLLQRMLSLPLNPPESYTPPPSPQAFAPPMPTPAPAPLAAPVAREMPAPAPAPAPMPRAFVSPAPEPAEPPQVWTPPAPAPRPAPAPMPAPIIERPAPVRAPVQPIPPAPEPLPYAAPHSEPVPFLFAPFVGFNAALNWSLGLFGFPGRVLRSGFVKTLLGLAGIGLLAYTGLKVAQIHGLITLPQELPWPPKPFE